MTKKDTYKNGQKVYEQKGETLTYYFKTGIVKARGKSIEGSMEGKWIFNRESGDLWQVGHFKANRKHGSWVRYDKEGNEEYRGDFKDGELVKKD